MSIAEKLQTIAENEQRVYEAGKQSVVIKGTKSGEVVTMTDVSPREHELAVKVERKNYLNFAAIKGTSVTAYGGTLSCGMDGGITGSGTATGYVGFQSIDYYLPISVYTFSASGNGTNIACTLTVKDANNASLYSTTLTYSGQTIKINLAAYPTYKCVAIGIKRNNNTVLSGTVYFKLEADVDISTVKVIASTEEERVSIYPVNADGTVDGVTSFSPTMILSTDKQGVLIECTYNRDINKSEEAIFEEGIQAEVKRFWDIMQVEGERVIYTYQFCGAGWTDETFTPQFDFHLQSDNTRMFMFSKITDLKGLLERLGRTFDTSKANNLSYFYESSSITKSPLIDTSGLKEVTRVFYAASALQEVALKLKDDGTQTFVGVFSNCTSLVDLEIQGVIGQNGFNVSPCTELAPESVLSVLDHLKSGVSGLTVTLGATNQGKVSPEKIAEAQAKGWTVA